MSYHNRKAVAVIILLGNPAVIPITIPNHEPIKVVYVKMVKEIVEAEEATRKED